VGHGFRGSCVRGHHCPTERRRDVADRNNIGSMCHCRGDRNMRGRITDLSLDNRIGEVQNGDLEPQKGLSRMLRFLG
jgi:hypothetical protein